MKKLLYILFATFLGIACEKDTLDSVPTTPSNPSGPSDPEVGEAAMTVIKDGNEYSVSAMASHLSIVTQTTSNPHNSIYVDTWIQGFKLSVKAKSFHFQNPPEEGVRIKKYSTNTHDEDQDTPYNECGDGDSDLICDKGKVIYYYTELYETRAITGKPYGLVEITDIDTVNYVVSGNFNATVYEMFEWYPDSMVFSGEFENIPYTIEYW